jgi:hypothetical protein
MGSPEESVRRPDDEPREAEARAAVNQSVIPEPGSGEPMWARIRRHKVVEWTLAYVAFGYALLHGVQMLRETFDWPLLGRSGWTTPGHWPVPRAVTVIPGKRYRDRRS